jgi:hypothetical protein
MKRKRGFPWGRICSVGQSGFVSLGLAVGLTLFVLFCGAMLYLVIQSSTKGSTPFIALIEKIGFEREIFSSRHMGVSVCDGDVQPERLRIKPWHIGGRHLIVIA